MDDYHGTKVADPYRWLEDETSPETAAWVEAQNAVTFPYLERIPYRQKLLERVMQLNDYERYSAPSRKGQYFFFSKNEGLQNQSVLFIQKGLDGAPEVLIDPNAWSADGTVQLTAFAPSKDAKYAVYGISRSGSDWQQYKVMELATKSTLADTVDWVKVSNVAWHGDGFYYSRYPEPPEGHEKASINENHQVFFHRLGTEQSDDTLVYEDRREPAALPHARHDRGRALRDPRRSPSAAQGKDGNALFVRDLSKAERDVRAARARDHDDTFSVVDNVGDKLLVSTNHGAPNWRVVLDRSARSRPRRTGRRCSRSGRSRSRACSTAGGKLFATYLKDVTTRAYVYALDGKLENEIALPGPGIGGRLRRAARRGVRVLHVQLAERAADDLPLRHRDAAELACSASRRCRATTPSRSRRSRCSTRARTARGFRCSSCYRKGLKLDGNNPTLLYGYGGFNIVAVADVQRGAHRAARAGVRLRVGEPARRRRVRRDLAPAGHEAARSRTCSTTSSRRPSGSSRTSTRRRRSSRSRAARTAGCSSAR